MAKIRVTAGHGRTVPIPSHLGTAPGAQLLHLTEGNELDVEESDYYVQRALGDGDLVKVEPKDAPTDKFPKAAAELGTTKES